MSGHLVYLLLVIVVVLFVRDLTVHHRSRYFIFRLSVPSDHFLNPDDKI